eukprot:COSAG02_NODE_5508_length_4271_cov_1.557047_8_plen_23_part_01
MVIDGEVLSAHVADAFVRCVAIG